MRRPKPWLTALLQLVILIATVASAAPLLDAKESPLPIPRRADDVSLRGRAARPIFNGSVVPGGVYSLEELRAVIERDPVVAAHYRAMNVDEMHLVTLTEGRAAYVSYRIGSRVFWTRNRVYLKAGETVLTDGHTTIRARCGNCVSEEKQQAESGVDPAHGELDEFVVPPTPEAGADAVSGEAEQSLGDLLAVPFGPQMFALLGPGSSPMQAPTADTFGNGGSPFFIGSPLLFPGGGGAAVAAAPDEGDLSSGGTEQGAGAGGTPRDDLTDTNDTPATGIVTDDTGFPTTTAASGTSSTGGASAAEPQVLWLVAVGLIGVARRRMR